VLRVTVAEDVVATDAVSVGLVVSSDSIATPVELLTTTSIAPAPPRIVLGAPDVPALTVATTATLTITLSNAGAVAAQSVRATVSLPAGIIGSARGGGGWTCLSGSTQSEFTCEADGVAAGGSLPLALDLTADSTAVSGSTVSITATHDGAGDARRLDVPLSVAPAAG